MRKSDWVEPFSFAFPPKIIIGIAVVVWLFIAALLILPWQQTQAQLLAVPGAEGGGKFAVGGRLPVSGLPAPRIIQVLNSSDSGANSFREACEATGPRIIVFKVGGTVGGGSYNCSPHATILGQTAPGGGFAIQGQFELQSNSIVTGLHVIGGKPSPNPGPNNGKSMLGASSVSSLVENVFISNLSVSLASRNNIFVRCTNSKMVQGWTIMRTYIGPGYNQDTSRTGWEGTGYFTSGPMNDNCAVDEVTSAFNVFGRIAKARNPQYQEYGNGEVVNDVLHRTNSIFSAKNSGGAAEGASVGVARGGRVDSIGVWAKNNGSTIRLEEPSGGATWVDQEYELHVDQLRCDDRTNNAQAIDLCFSYDGDTNLATVTPMLSSSRLFPALTRTAIVYDPFLPTFDNLIVDNAGAWNVDGGVNYPTLTRSRTPLEDYLRDQILNDPQGVSHPLGFWNCETQASFNAGDCANNTSQNEIGLQSVNRTGCNQGILTCDSQGFPTNDTPFTAGTYPLDTDADGLPDFYEDEWADLDKSDDRDNADFNPDACVDVGGQTVCYRHFEVYAASLIPCMPAGAFRTPDCAFPSLGGGGPPQATIIEHETTPDQCGGREFVDPNDPGSGLKCPGTAENVIIPAAISFADDCKIDENQTVPSWAVLEETLCGDPATVDIQTGITLTVDGSLTDPLGAKLTYVGLGTCTGVGC